MDSDCCRLPTASVLSDSGQIALQSVLINKPKFRKAPHRTKIREIVIPRSMVVEALSWWSRRASQHPAVQSPVHPWKNPTNLARSPLLVGPRRKKTDRGQRSAFLSETSLFAPFILAHRASALSWLVDDRAALHPRRIWCVPTRAGRLSVTVLPASRLPHPEGHQIGVWRRHAPGNTILSQSYRRRVSTDQLNREDSQSAASLVCKPGSTPAGKTLPCSCPETTFRRERA